MPPHQVSCRKWQQPQGQPLLGLVLQTHIDRLRGTAPVATVQHIEAGVAALLVVLAGWLVIEALVLMRSLRRPLASASATASAV